MIITFHLALRNEATILRWFGAARKEDAIGAGASAAARIWRSNRQILASIAAVSYHTAVVRCGVLNVILIVGCRRIPFVIMSSLWNEQNIGFSATSRHSDGCIQKRTHKKLNRIVLCANENNWKCTRAWTECIPNEQKTKYIWLNEYPWDTNH